jgi:hypothetical protein
MLLQHGDLKTFFVVLVLTFPLSRAEHRRRGRKKRAGLSERSEFRHAPTLSTTRRKKRDRGVFFWLLFCHAEEK